MRILVTLLLLYFLTRSDSLQKKWETDLSKIINRHYFRDSSLFSSKISSHYPEVKKALILVLKHIYFAGFTHCGNMSPGTVTVA